MLGAAIVFALFAVIERVAPGYRWPKEPFWVLRGVVWFAASVAIGHFTAEVVHRFLGHYALFELEFLGLWAVLPALFLYELLTYGFHRALHGVPLLWRAHQLHHSSEHLDVWSTWRVHPFEQIGYTLASSLISIGLLGTSASTAFAVSLVLLLVGHLQHSNLSTPRWLGYIVARPENHMLHHARGTHTSNYSDFPLIDWLFGTFELPLEAPESVGFWDGASRRVGAMLIGQDVTHPVAKPEP